MPHRTLGRPWAHYLHIMDMVETAYFFGLKVNPTIDMKEMKAKASFDPYTEDDFDAIILCCEQHQQGHGYS